MARPALVSSLAIVCALAGPAARADGALVLVLDDAAHTRPDFATVAGIHLTGVASVARPGVVGGRRLSERIAATAALCRERGATAGAWVEPGDDGELRMVVVGPSEGRALIDIVRSSGGEGWDPDRTLALKLRAIVERVRQAEPDGAFGAALASAARRDRANARAVELGWVSTASAWGATGSGDVGVQAAAVFGLGVSLERPAFRLEIAGSLRVPSGLDMRAPALGDIEISELAPALAATAMFDFEGVWVGARVEAPLRLLSVTGTTAAGAQGEVTRVVPALSAGLVARLPIGRPIAVELAAGVEVALDDRAFGLNRAAVGTLGRGRGYALFSLVISGP